MFAHGLNKNIEYNCQGKEDMGSYNRNNRSGGGGGRRYGGGGGGFRGGDSGRREMHKAVCDECGKDCEVPFRPSGDKPIYCSDCFEKKDGGGSRRPSQRDSSSGFANRDNTNKQLLEQVTSLNTKLDRILAVIESGSNKKEKVETKNVEKKEVKKEVQEEPKEKIQEVKKVVKKATPKEKIVEKEKTTENVVERSPAKE